MRGPARGAARLALLLLAGPLPALAGCTEDAITGVDPDEAPGASAETREVELQVTELPAWRDTSLAGFALPGAGGFGLVADTGALRARMLGAFPEIPDTLIVGFDTAAVEGFEDIRLRVRVDTLNSAFPEFPFTLRLFSLEQPYDPLEVTWERAAAGRPWATPGGDLGRELAAFEFEAVRDTVTVPLANGDSLLEAWREAPEGSGFALVVEETGARLRVQQVQLLFSALLEDREEPEETSRFASDATFIYDPRQPAVERALRLAGLPAWRFYVTLRLPERIDDIPLREATINYAEIEFHGLELPPEPFAPDQAISLQAVELLGDPFELGERTPVGDVPPTVIVLEPETFERGTPLRIDVTNILLEAIFLPEEGEPIREVRFGVRPIPDGQAFGFVEFASIDHPDPALRPELRVVLTPPTPFGAP